MKGDIIHIKPIYFETSEAIISKMPSKDLLNKYVIVIGGESGSGKSVAAVCLQKLLHNENINSVIIHQDDYFFLPPKSNHQNRVKNIENVGTQEVNLMLLQQHIFDFKKNKESIEKPLVDYDNNTISTEIIEIKNAQVLILEGTYSLKLTHADLTIFMDRTYKETVLQRTERGREQFDEFIEKVLFIEHQIIRRTKEYAQLIVNKNYLVETTELYLS